MLCDKCKKNPAVIHIKEFVNGKCKNLNLCQECAAKNGDGLLPPEIGLNISEMIMEHFPFMQNKGHENPQKKDNVKRCPVCSWSMDDVESHGKIFACPECYKTFRKKISLRLQSMCGFDVIHRGKRPLNAAENSPVAIRNQLFILKKQLQQFIAAEDYESAALCRDQIIDLETRCSTENYGEF